MIRAVALLVALAGAAHALTGAEIYEQGCASCHGADGKGAAGTGVTVPLPDFTDCAFVTAESTGNWVGLVRHGGPFLGMSTQMPGFGGSLSDAEIRSVLDHVRGFCHDARYPIGDLNYRRTVFVEKAFPEDEAIASGEFVRARGERAGVGELALEKRLGARGQLELALPGEIVAPDRGARVVGAGDVGVTYKHVLVAAPRLAGTILAAAAGVQFPSGNFRHGVGAGTLVATPGLMSGHRLGPVVAQTQVEADLPVDPGRVAREIAYRVALQWPLGPYKKDLVPAVEFEQTEGLAHGVHAATLVGPSLYLPLSRRGHVAVGVGGLVPVAGTRPFDWTIAGFFLWEYTDGPIWAW